MENKTFDEVVNQNAHAEEIAFSRLGGLGGSDADMVLRVGRRGLSALTMTDRKRLAVMKGDIPFVPFAGNIYTQAGHLFEDWAEKATPNSFSREVKLSKELTRNFKTFAHADFYSDKTKSVIECKFVQDDAPAVAKRYEAQLQWYFLLGANYVSLLHGVGDVDPFKVKNAEFIHIQRDELIINDLLNGLKLLDDYLPEIVYIDMEATSATTSDDERDLFDALAVAKKALDNAQNTYNEIKAKVESMMADQQLAKYSCDWFTITRTAPTTSRTFDTKTFLKSHPEFDNEDNYKTTSRAGALIVKFE